MRTADKRSASGGHRSNWRFPLPRAPWLTNIQGGGGTLAVGHLPAPGALAAEELRRHGGAGEGNRHGPLRSHGSSASGGCRGCDVTRRLR